MVQEAQLRDQEREVALKEAEEESRLQEQVFGLNMRFYIWGPTMHCNVGPTYKSLNPGYHLPTIG